MNRLIASIAPVLSLAQLDDAGSIMLLQKHAAKTQQPGMPGMLTEIPADRVPPFGGYAQGDKLGFNNQRACGMDFTSTENLAECAAKCDSQSNCEGFQLTNMMLYAPIGTPISYVCEYGCTGEGTFEHPGSYAYYRTVTSTTTTTATTTEKYVYKPSFAGNCAPAWSEEKINWCCENEPGFAGSEQFCPQPAAVADPHITSIKGERFDVYKPGDHEFVVLPKGSSPENADLHISGKVTKIGGRENDLWIRKLKVQGKWVQHGPYEFKTSNVPFGKKKSALIRFGGSKSWKAMDASELDSNLHVVSAVDKKAPEADFAQSISKKLELKAGPVTVLIDYVTSQKNGEDINHLDLHLKGLQSSHTKSMGGLLAGDVSALQLKK